MTGGDFFRYLDFISWTKSYSAFSVFSSWLWGGYFVSKNASSLFELIKPFTCSVSDGGVALKVFELLHD